MESCLTDPQWKWKELSGTVRGPGYTLESGRSLHIAMVKVTPSLGSRVKAFKAALKSCTLLDLGVSSPWMWTRGLWSIQYCLLWRGKGQKAKVALLFSEECGLSASPHSLINGRPTHG